VANGDNVSVLLGNGDGTFQAARNYAAGSFPFSMAVGDFNGDGRLDLAVAGAGGVRVLLGNGDGSFLNTNISYVAGTNPSSVAVGDFNGDGSPDLAVANVGSGDVSILLNDNVWAPGPRPSGRGHSSDEVQAAATARFAAPAWSPVASAPAALPLLPETLPRPARAPLRSAPYEVRREPPPLPAAPAPPGPARGTPARVLNRLFADPEGPWRWDRAADLDPFAGPFGLLAEPNGSTP
jgi:hypothetical protein